MHCEMQTAMQNYVYVENVSGEWGRCVGLTT
jgi:hypothetical protein